MEEILKKTIELDDLINFIYSIGPPHAEGGERIGFETADARRTNA